MKQTDVKAVRLVLSGAVDILDYTIDDDDVIVTATGTVQGRDLYRTHFTPDTVVCTCEYGQHRDTSHSHDQALRLAVQRQIERTQT